MRSAPPNPEDLDADWGPGDAEEDPDSTRMVDSRELFARAGFQVDDPAARGEESEADESGHSEGRITLPPPVPVNEYVSKMMDHRTGSSSELTAVRPPELGDAPEDEPVPDVPRSVVPWAPPEVADDFEGTLDGLLKEQPVPHLDFDEPGVASPPTAVPSGGTLRAPFGMEAAAVASSLDVDLLGDRAAAAGFGDIEGLDSPQDPRWAPRAGRAGAPSALPGVTFGARLDEPPRRAPSSPGELPDLGPPTPAPYATPRGADARRDIDFRLDLGFDAPATSSEEPAPETPPPGTLRYGLVEDDPTEQRASLEEGGDLGELFLGDPDGAAEAPYVAVDTPFDGAVELYEGDPATYPDAPPSSDTPELSFSEGEDPEVEVDDEAHTQMRARFEAGDYGGALVLAEGLLDEDPDDRTARRYAESCAEMLRQMYKARIGDGSQVLRLAVSPGDIRSLSLDHRAGFLLSCIDGFSSIDEILDVSGMRTLEALRILYELVQEGIVRCDDEPR